MAKETYKKKKSAWFEAHGSGELVYDQQGRRAGMTLEQLLRVYSLIHKGQRERLELCGLYNLKPVPNDTPLTKPHFPVLPKHFHL